MSARSSSEPIPFRVVVLGAGYAGVIAANHILSTVARRPAPGRAVEVTVVNPRPDFVERIRLHEVAAGTRPTAARPLADVLHAAARLRVGTATRIDAPARVVHGPDWSTPYDALVYAVGSRTATEVPGSAEHATPLGEPDRAEALRQEVAGLPAGSVVAVVGGGLTGIEAAAELAERHPRLDVRLVSAGPVAAGLGDRARRTVRRTLDRLEVGVLERAAVTEVRPGRLILADGGSLGFDACAWTASMVAPDLARDSGLAVDALGRLLVDETLRHPDRPDIVGAGDAVAPPAAVAGHLRMSCAAAMPLGVHAADVVLAALDAVPPSPVSVGFLAQCVSLGRADGVVQGVRRDDTPRSFSFGGHPAAFVKERICRYTIAGLRAERRRPGGYPTVRGPRSLPAAAPSVEPVRVLP